MRLETGWLNVAREGQTVDKRKLTRGDIEQMGNNYKPTVKEAVINYAHYRPIYNLGHVIETRHVEDDDGRLRLQARLAPNLDCLYLNQRGQKKYFSVEIHREIDGFVGQAYLYGLALTDEPASLGTDRMELFSAGSDEGKVEFSDYFESEIFGADVPAFDVSGSDLPTFEELTGKTPEQQKNWFAEKFKSLFKTNPEENQVEEMTKDELALAIQAGVEEGIKKHNADLEQKFGAIDEKITALSADGQDPQDGGDADNNQTRLDELKSENADLKKQLEKHTTPATPGKDDDDDEQHFDADAEPVEKISL